jgi:hypothetical protein
VECQQLHITFHTSNPLIYHTILHTPRSTLHNSQPCFTLRLQVHPILFDTFRQSRQPTLTVHGPYSRVTAYNPTLHSTQHTHLRSLHTPHSTPHSHLHSLVRNQHRPKGSPLYTFVAVLAWASQAVVRHFDPSSLGALYSEAPWRENSGWAGKHTYTRHNTCHRWKLAPQPTSRALVANDSADKEHSGRVIRILSVFPQRSRKLVGFPSLNCNNSGGIASYNQSTTGGLSARLGLVAQISRATCYRKWTATSDIFVAGLFRSRL